MGIFAVTAAPLLPCLHPQSLEVVLYYKASHTDLHDLIQEEVEAGEEEEVKKDAKKDSCNELASVRSEPTEIKSAKAEEGCSAESQEQEGKEEDKKDESDNDACPEASESSNPLKLSESKKVTGVEGHIEWAVGCGAQVPWCGGLSRPEDGLLQERPRGLARGEWSWSREWRKRALPGMWRAEANVLWTCVSKIASSGNPGGAVAVLPPFTAFALHPYIRRSSPFTSRRTEDAAGMGPASGCRPASVAQSCLLEAPC